MAIRENIKFLKHQTKGIEFMLAHNYTLCADEQGLGKTLEAIAVQQAADAICVICCPATLKYNWLEEYKKFTDETNVKVGLSKAKINIINYEQLKKARHLFETASMVIFDEAHYLIHLTSQRTQFAHEYIGEFLPERLLLLTGTPVKERVSDFYSIIRLLSLSPIKNNGRSILDKFRTQSKFSDYFSNRISFNVKVKGRRGDFTKRIVKYEGVRNEKELKVYMKFKYLRRTAKKVLDLPPVIFKDVIASYKQNSELDKAFQAHEDGEDFNISAKVEAARVVAPFTADYVKDLLQGGSGPVIVFSDHIEPLKTIATKLKKYKSAFIIGEIEMEQRQRNVNSFQAGELDIIFCSYGAAATGITLTRSNNMVLNDPTWEASAMAQALKRFDRIGQLKTPIVHSILGTRSSKKIATTLEKKQRDIGKLIS